MVERVLVPVDDSEHARRAVEFVRGEFPAAGVVLLHVIDPSDAASLPFTTEDWFADAEARADELLAEMATLADEETVPVERVVEVDKPTRAIVDYAETHDVDHVVMGSHGRDGMSRALLGSVAETVVRRSPVPVTVTR